MTDTKFDIVLYGATSFVGQIVARYMHEQFSDGSVSWAIAARSKSKMEDVAAEIGMSDIEMIVADARDEAALAAMCARAKVVISTVGPYALYGDTLVKVCAESGTHYCDLTGEPHWIAKMLGQHEAKAKQTGARIVHCCGFDSIPSDLGVHFLQSQAKASHGEACERIDMRVMRAKGGASGGTVASMIEMVKEASGNKELQRQLKNPYSLCPPDHDFSVRQPSVGLSFDERVNSWIAPFIMAAINTRIVHRSNALSGNAYGTTFKYEEAMATGRGGRGKRCARLTKWGLGALTVGLAVPPTRWLLENVFLPKPGEGPSPEEQRNGMFDMLFIGTTDSGKEVRCRVTGDRDPGYGSTAKMLAQAAACLAQDVPDEIPGGFWTPATLLGDKLVQRLQAHSGLTFAVESVR
ncbi:saccharopine dehydrogenase family protein [Aurantiacibacter gangjinensis]|uniref:Saccharopine dehydrogenase n=1 Tax=Aurantiacibacter gangjinensis TaxID=502682 RepID=A0A0G9MRK9_9SPHN|nr:saccharopine dehydrogenase NADP-binding domain-containing protein [Aurantiacibacter gangjinensis]APE26876.1 putative membrane protein [Aurantiacibacter gangjinensis]KLE33345.1 saccharopine dehydrogenase [Aurantiacibacter gangjinensis]